MLARATALVIACGALGCATRPPPSPPVRTPTPTRAFVPAAYCARVKAESVQSPGAIVLPGGLLLSPPHVLTEVVAPFPEAARQNRRTGHVVMKVEVKETGDVGRVEVVESAGADFDAAAADAMRRFAFKPACSPEGTPVAAYIHYKYLFGSP